MTEEDLIKLAQQKMSPADFKAFEGRQKKNTKKEEDWKRAQRQFNLSFRYTI